MTHERHRDPGIGVWELGPTDDAPWLIVCPVCARRAVRKGARLICVHCGLDRTSPSRPEAFWLRTPCCGEELYALNEGHLELLEGYLLASQRERRRDGEGRWHNQSVTSRLPRWMKAAKHRDEIARGLGRLRARLAET